MPDPPSSRQPYSDPSIRNPEHVRDPSALKLTEVASQTARHDSLIRQLQGRALVGTPGPAGPVGPQGPPGVAGPPGSGGGTGSDANYVHTQSSAAVTWTVAHGLGKYGSVEVVDTGGNWLLPDVHYVDLNTLTVTFAGANSGKAYVN